MTKHLTSILALLLLAAAVMTGQQALAASKTVTYHITATHNDNNYTLTFVPSSNGFNYNHGDKTVNIPNINSTTGFHVELDDGLYLQLSLSPAGLSFYNNNEGHTGIWLNFQNNNQNAYLTLGSSHYYVTHVKMANLNGDALTGRAAPWTGNNAQMDVDVDMVTESDALEHYRTFSANITTQQIFAYLTVTYGDPRDYTITYNNAVNGQNGVINNNPSTYRVNTNTFQITEPMHTGYDFDGFTYTDAAHPTATNAELPMTISRGEAATRKAITFNASWTANTYTLRLHHNDGSNDYTDMAMTYDVAANLQTVTRTGYTFANWSTNLDGTGTTYTEGQSVSNLTSTNGATVNLYAQWTANTYTVTLDSQNATTPGTTSVTATYDAAMPAITVPTKTDYIFGGYYTATNGGGTKYYNADGSSAHNWDIASATTLYAQWIATYTVTLDNQNATTPGTTFVTATYGAAMPAITVPTKTDYIFGGYYTATNGGGTKYYNADGSSAHNWDILEATTLYAL